MKRGITILFILTFLIISSGSAVLAQATSKEITDTFFQLYAKDPLKAVDYAFSTNKWMNDKKDDIDKLKTKFKEFIGQMGSYYSNIFLSEKSAGADFKRVTFLVKYDREPLKFTFLLYKPKDKWMVYNFSYDDNLDSEFKP